MPFYQHPHAVAHSQHLSVNGIIDEIQWSEHNIFAKPVAERNAYMEGVLSVKELPIGMR